MRYFALLSEQAGVSIERLEHGGDLSTLYVDCGRRHAFTLAAEMIRPAVNDEFVSWDYPIAEGDTIAFIPPVSGG